MLAAVLGACAGSGGSNDTGNTLTPAECATYPTCSVDVPCSSDSCIALDLCDEPICIDAEEACERVCGSTARCSILESYPEQIECTSAVDPSTESSYCETCTLRTQMDELVADGAEDCGTVPVGGDDGSVRACVEAALAEGRAFQYVVREQGIDSNVSNGWVGTATGTVMHLSYDSNICGGATCADGCGPRVGKSTCVDPIVGESDPIDCTDLGEHETLCEPP